MTASLQMYLFTYLYMYYRISLRWERASEACLSLDILVLYDQHYPFTSIITIITPEVLIQNVLWFNNTVFVLSFYLFFIPALFSGVTVSVFGRLRTGLLYSYFYAHHNTIKDVTFSQKLEPRNLPYSSNTLNP